MGDAALPLDGQSVIAYASRTGSRRNLAALRQYGWRLIVSAKGVQRTEGFPYAIDNGAWTAYQQSEPFDSAAFEICVLALGERADFIVVPDIVAGGLESLRFSVSWLSWLRSKVSTRLLLAVQDGIVAEDIRSILGPRMGIFVGGTTEWKEQSLPLWGALAKETGVWLHVGRVNSERRIALCAAAGVTSFDGTSVTRFSCTAGRLDRARKQPDLFVA